jgi:hypothetical protein
VPYRAPAENEDAARDAAEVAAFAAHLRAKRVKVWLLTGAILALCVGAFGLMMALGILVSTPPPPPFPPNCHDVIVMTTGEDGKFVSTHRIDCTVPAPSPSR